MNTQTCLVESYGWKNKGQQESSPSSWDLLPYGRYPRCPEETENVSEDAKEQLNEANRKIAELQEQLTALRNQDDNCRQDPTFQEKILYDPEGSIPDGWRQEELYKEVKRLQDNESGVAWNHSTKAQAWTKIQKHHRKYHTDHGGEWPAGKLLVKDDGQRIFKQDDGTYLDTSGQLLVAS